MSSLLSLSMLLQFAAENIALFSGGLFSGAAIYISLTEHPPRTLLSVAEILALSRTNARRIRLVLTSLAVVTAIAALLAALLGSGRGWLVGGIAHAVAASLLLTQGARIVEALDELGAGPQYESLGRSLLQRQALHYSILSLAGLVAQGLFILKP